MDSVVEFGKYSGFTLDEIMQIDPDYLKNLRKFRVSASNLPKKEKYLRILDGLKTDADACMICLESCPQYPKVSCHTIHVDCLVQDILERKVCKCPVCKAPYSVFAPEVSGKLVYGIIKRLFVVEDVCSECTRYKHKPIYHVRIRNFGYITLLKNISDKLTLDEFSNKLVFVHLWKVIHMIIHNTHLPKNEADKRDIALDIILDNPIIDHIKLREGLTDDDVITFSCVRDPHKLIDLFHEFMPSINNMLLSVPPQVIQAMFSPPPQQPNGSQPNGSQPNIIRHPPRPTGPPPAHPPRPNGPQFTEIPGTHTHVINISMDI
jgi:hypothetical protein